MKRNKFSLSNTKLFTADMGELVPAGLIEVLPGDTIQQATSALVRCQPLLAPLMHRVDVSIHHFFVPHRLIWEDWEAFITGGEDGMNASVFPTISLNTTTGAEGTLADYLGVPTVASGTLEVSALPFRAYDLIWNEWYRDQDLQQSLVISKESGVDATTSTDLQYRGWEKDYFTSARPWTQKGPEVSIPLTGDAPVKGIAVGNIAYASAAAADSRESGGTGTPTGTDWSTAGGPTSDFQIQGNNGVSPTVPNIRADLSGVTAADVNDLRLAFALQRYEEARARYGSRYTEYLAYLGVRSSDARLQRPEYLGGGKAPVQFAEVLQTSPTTDGDDSEGVGNLKGHGIGAMRSNRYRRFFEEHGYVVSLFSVMPRTQYVQGLPRTWNRRVKEDFWQKELEHIGQQEILNKELYAAHATPNGTFGYQDRYDEYRRIENTIAGEMRSIFNYWHMARIFASEPVLNASFVRSNPTKRVFAEQTQDSLWVKCLHSVQARRMVAKSGTSYIF